MLCITMEIHPRSVKQYKCHHCCSCKNYWGKWMEGGKKCLCVSIQKSREVAALLLGQFLSRCCFMLCITMEIQPRSVKQYKCHHCCSCKNYWGKGMEGGQKCLCVIFLLTRRSRVHENKSILGHTIARATKYCLLPDTFWLWASKNAFKVGSVKFADTLSPPSIVKKVRTGSKSSQRT